MGQTYFSVIQDFLCGEMSHQKICLKFCTTKYSKCCKKLLATIIWHNYLCTNRSNTSWKTKKTTRFLGVLACPPTMKLCKKFENMVNNKRITINEVAEVILIYPFFQRRVWCYSVFVEIQFRDRICCHLFHDQNISEDRSYNTYDMNVTSSATSLTINEFLTTHNIVVML